MKLASRPHYADHMAGVDVPDDVALVASYADLVKARRTHRRIVLMQHGIGQSYSDRNPAYPGGRDNDAVGLFLVPGPAPADRWKAAYPRAAVEVVGTPMLDDLPSREPGPTTVAVTFHWLYGSIPEKRHAFDHFGKAAVALKNDFDIIGTGHPRATRMSAFWTKHGIEYVPDFREVCRRADVLVFDNTSAGYLFAATGRPVVVMNSPHYRPDVHHGLRFWDAADIGVQVHAAADLGPGIARALEERPVDVERREAALDRVFGFRSGAARRASDAIAEWAA